MILFGFYTKEWQLVELIDPIIKLLHGPDDEKLDPSVLRSNLKGLEKYKQNERSASMNSYKRKIC
jgi:hypothetical protein